MPSNVYAEDYSSIEGKTIIFYDARYNKAFIWWVDNEEETVEAVRAWTALGVPAVGLFEGRYVDSGEPQLVPFDGYTVDDLKQYLTVNNGCVIPPGMKGECDLPVRYTRTVPVPDDEWGL
jgi:hypothetical protein